MRFLSKKDKKDCISILAKHWNKKRGFFSMFSPAQLKSAEPLPAKLPHDCRIVKERDGGIYICIPANYHINNRPPSNRVIALDPGQRTILTGFDSDGNVVEIGKDSVARIGRLLHYMRKLQGKVDVERTHKRRQNLKRALERSRKRINNLVQELHKKSTNFLLNNYDVVLAPKLNFHNLGSLNKKLKSKMATLSHCAMVDRMINKSSRLNNSHVVAVAEDFTSKACSGCGHLNYTLGRSRVFNCSGCGLTADRDHNAAKNILLKYIQKELGDVCLRALGLGPASSLG